MALVLADRVRDTTTTTSTGTITLSGTAPTGFQNFSVIGNGNTTYYTIAHQTANEWEVGIGTYTSSGTTLARTTILASSNSGSVVNLSAGTKDVFVTYPAERSVNLSSAALTSGRIPYATTDGLLVDAANLTFNGTTLTANTIGAFTLSGTVAGGGNQLNNVVIGTTTPLAGTFSSLTDTGNLTFTGTGNRITGDFTSVANGVYFQTSTANSPTNVAAIPNGSSPLSGFQAYSSTDPSNASVMSIGIGTSGTESVISSFTRGTGTALPIRFNVGGSERVRVDTSGNVGIGTSSPAYKLDVAGAISTNNNLTFTGTGNRITGDFTNATVANRVAFQTSTTNGVSVVNVLPNGTGVTAALQVSNNSDITAALAFGNFQCNSTEVSLQSGVRNAGTYLPITFSTSSNERVRIDTSGNVGIGTSSPSSYASPLSVYAATNPTLSIASGNANAYLRLYSTSDNNMYLTNTGGSMTMITANSERMRIDSNGAVLINQSSSYTSAFGESPRFQVSQLRGVAPSISAAFYCFGNDGVGARISLGKSRGTAIGTQTIVQNGDELGGLYFCGSDGSNMNQVAASIIGISGGVPGATADMPGSLLFNTTADGAGSPTERMRIDSSGNVGIGTSSLSSKFTVTQNQAALSYLLDTYNTTNGGGSIWRMITNNIANTGATSVDFYKPSGSGFSLLNNDSNAANFTAFGIGGTERMRIDSSGNLLVGGTGQIWDERELVRSDTDTVKLGIYGNATSFTSSIIRAQVETAAGAGWYFFEGRSSGGVFQYGIRGNGTVATSDERRKKNIEPARSYIDDICKIRVVKYNWKSDEDTTPKELGWIAQEVAEVFPNMVVTHHDGPNDDQEVLLLKKEVFVPMLMKCIQELKAELDVCKAEIAALKAKLN